ncbi:hypothetical protein JQ607_20975 [Bradyrhizobium liaoningense]|nr:hypothetical protein [Bradyrhizobium liaoningense]MBR0842683.1 hypothetical protein [Bradyrhizobium liaoningense]MBR0858965.1 hypothetical protein [Bradyrhizobium liaoningense]
MHRNVVTPVHLFAGAVLLATSTGGAPLTRLTVSVAQAAEEMPKDMLAAQIRTQGFACDKAVRATRDAKRSRPDHAVWVLKCSNASYRVSRAPDMAARVQPLE